MNRPNLRITVPALIAILCLAGCIPAAKAGFSRYHRGGTSELSVALYSGYPPADYPYRSLGAVQGEYQASRNEMVGNATEKALNNLTESAKAKGANAVINIKLNQQLRTYTYTGEAVIFDSVPFSKKILIGDVLLKTVSQYLMQTLITILFSTFLFTAAVSSAKAGQGDMLMSELMSSQEAQARSNLRAMSAVAEKFAVAHDRKYPTDSSELGDKDFCGKIVGGFSYSCTFSTQRYAFTAKSVSDKLGYKVFTMIAPGNLSASEPKTIRDPKYGVVPAYHYLFISGAKTFTSRAMADSAAVLLPLAYKNPSPEAIDNAIRDFANDEGYNVIHEKAQCKCQEKDVTAELGAYLKSRIGKK